MFSDFLLGELSLPGDLFWADEFTFNQVQSKHSTAINGALINEVSVRQNGRPITLQSLPNGGWISRAQYAQIQALVDDPEQPVMNFRTPDGRAFQVQFRSDNGNAVLTAQPLIHIWPAIGGDWLLITLRLIEV